MKKIDFNADWEYEVLTNRAEHPGREKITLPHDAMLHEKRTENSPGAQNTGYFEGNDYLYCKSFWVPENWREKHILIEFEGIYRNADIRLNGEQIYCRPNGYMQFLLSLDDRLQYGKENTIEVYVKNSDQPNSRWYSGAGIYRPAWLYVGEKSAVEPENIRITTVKTSPAFVKFEIYAQAPCRITLEIGHGLQDDEVYFITESKDSDECGNVALLIKVENARLWSAENPYLYRYRITAGADVSTGTFGIRELSWDAEKGFCINGVRTILKGACIHHDNGLLGACCYPDAEERKVRLLKETGYNAIRSAHNPCSKALLDACDRLGMLVLDEYTDMWYIHKTRYDYALYMENQWEKDLLDMVNKDYNHPCVVMYSTGNEVAETAQEKGIELTKDMTAYLHRLDRTRPVTCGVNIFFNLLSSMGFGVYSDKKAEDTSPKKKAVGSEFYNRLAGMVGDTFMKMGACLHGCDVKTRDAYENMDIAGYNYGILRYRHDLKKYPKRLILGTETFCRDAAKFYEIAEKHPRILGDFVWAGMDYIGETGVGAWEYEDYAPKNAPKSHWLTAGSGRIDITGKPLGEALYTKVVYEQEKGPFLAVRPVYQTGKHSPSAWKMTDAMESWSFRGCEGKRAEVEVYTRESAAALFLNGRKIAKKKRKKDCRIRFTVPYENGCLKAIVYDEAGEEAGCCELITAGATTCLLMIPEKSTVRPGELLYVRLQYTDERGILKPMEHHRMQISVTGGKLLGFGNACPCNPEGYLNSYADSYYGEALAIIQAQQADTIVARANDGSLEQEIQVPVISG